MCAAAVGLQQAMIGNRQLRKVLTFHKSVAHAEAFSQLFDRLEWLENGLKPAAFQISGYDSPGVRKEKMTRLASIST